ncbi:PAS domain S-box protein [Methylobacterium sp. E-066]|uniref:PAS domain S-box protein n=1 Tax=Methylobacterium sp. E-066 TaxID=2836584 RepID=UPI001FBAD36F|nr:helix-turn-helix transcriptional regulator [Methylobacterium sp. E-066]MCJ2142238.1 helix-turn-helix transcriptional regulator [Methylobacterium sp. E-066]
MTQFEQRQLAQVVDGLAEGVILIEPDHTIAYANDAALAMHGVTELRDLGATVAEYRGNFILHYRNHREVGPLQHPVERILAGEAFRDAVVEVHHFRDPARTWTHRMRGLVTTDDAGTPNGLALLMQDASDRYEAEERFECMFRANPAPAVVCRLSDLRYVKVNQGFIELTGYARDQVLGRTFTEVDLIGQGERRASAVEHLHAGTTIRQREACLSVPSDAEKYVIVAGHPIEMPGGERCMLFTFADLEDRRKAEAELRLSEERFAKAFELSPIPTALLSSDAKVPTSVNEAYAAAFGNAAHATSVPWAEEAERTRFKRELQRYGRVRAFEGRLRTQDGDVLDCLVSAERVSVNGGDGLLCAAQDISSRKRTEVELISAIESVMADASWFSHGVIEKLAQLRNPPKPGKPQAMVERLTTREGDMLEGICRGDTDEEISKALGVSLSTVRNHVASLYRKIGVNRRSAVVVWARERGIGEKTSIEHYGKNTTRKPGRKH